MFRHAPRLAVLQYSVAAVRVVLRVLSEALP